MMIYKAFRFGVILVFDEITSSKTDDIQFYRIDTRRGKPSEKHDGVETGGL